ncbi:zinc-finger domain-containing protein [Phlyctochytrium arcticum]|nr:zinc-finger domain-containing protein [Phlyctochytrium arcticum]
MSSITRICLRTQCTGLKAPLSTSTLRRYASSGVPQVQQAANRSEVWSAHQQKKQVAMSGPRFEQTDLSLQPNPLSAQELINQVPVKFVSARRVSCDGGGGALGHPKVYLNLDKDGPQPCGYCGLRFQQEHHH